jgi:exosortase family protein XrtM
MALVGRLSGFVLVFALLHLAWQAFDDSRFEHSVVDGAVVAPAAVLIRAFTPQLEFKVVGNRLWESRGGLNIVKGCDGTETLFLLIAAFAVAPIALRARVVGVLAGIPVVFAVNVMRVLALFYSHHAQPELFGFMHGLVTPAFMVISVAIFYSMWLRGPRHVAVASAV